MSPLVDRVHKLEDKYRHGGKVSFLFVPDEEYKKFAKYRDEYFKQQEKVSNENWISYCRSKPYRKAMNDFLSKTETAKYTVDELTEMIDRDPILNDHGHHMHESNAVYALLNQKGLKWRKKSCK